VDTGSREENASNRVASTTRSLLKPGRNTLPTIDLLARFRDRLSLPLIAAPMFLVSGTDLVVAACRNGVRTVAATGNTRPAGGTTITMACRTGMTASRTIPREAEFREAIRRVKVLIVSVLRMGLFEIPRVIT